MAVTKVVWNINGFYELRRAPGVVTDLVERANRIAAAANSASGTDGYRISHMQGKKGSIPKGQNPFYPGASGKQGRYRATVITANYAAAKDNARFNRLLQALDSGR